MKVYKFEEVEKEMGNSFQSGHICQYLSNLGAKSIIAEKNYIDKDYIVDYSNFYARSFNDYGRCTTRLHFFKKEIIKEEFIEKFHSDKHFQNALIASYLGFVVIKPIESIPKMKFIGRTILKTDILEEDRSKIIKPKSSASLYGLRLNIYSLPYQTQDSVVAACATTAIWTSLHALNATFGTQKQSPFEITKTSVSFPGMERNFPSKGLDIFQIKNYFNSIGMETEYINVENCPEVIPDAITAHLNYELPVIAGIELIRNDGLKSDFHAVVISGYHYDKNGEIDKIYIHDDQIGPYTEVYSNKNHKDFSHWKNEWITADEFENLYEDIVVKNLLIPLYPKIRISFNKIYGIFLEYKKITSTRGIIQRLYLTDTNKYKEYLLSQSFECKGQILMSQFPKYLWVIRVQDSEKPIFDFIFDATSPFKEDTIFEINYL